MSSVSGEVEGEPTLQFADRGCWTVESGRVATETGRRYFGKDRNGEDGFQVKERQEAKSEVQ